VNPYLALREEEKREEDPASLKSLLRPPRSPLWRSSGVICSTSPVETYSTLQQSPHEAGAQGQRADGALSLEPRICGHGSRCFRNGRQPRGAGGPISLKPLLLSLVRALPVAGIRAPENLSRTAVSKVFFTYGHESEPPTKHGLLP